MDSRIAGGTPGGKTPPNIPGTTGKRPRDQISSSPSKPSTDSAHGISTIPTDPRLHFATPTTPSRKSKRPRNTPGRPASDSDSDMDEDVDGTEEEGTTTPTLSTTKLPTPGQDPFFLPSPPSSPEYSALRAKLYTALTEATILAKNILELTKHHSFTEPHIIEQTKDLFKTITGSEPPRSQHNALDLQVLKALADINAKVDRIGAQATPATQPPPPSAGLEASIHAPGTQKTYAAAAKTNSSVQPTRPPTLRTAKPGNPNRAHDPTRLVVTFNADAEGKQREDSYTIVQDINRHLRNNNAPAHLMVTAVKWNERGNCIVITRSDQKAADILPYTEGLANVIIPGATGTVREDKRWFKIEIGNVRTGTKDGNGEGAYSSEYIHEQLRLSNPEYEAITQFITMKPRWVRPESELSHQSYSSVVFAVDSQEAHQEFLAHKAIRIFGVVAKVREWSDRPPLIQCNRCWDYGHRTTRCQAATARCRLCGEDHSEDHHPRPAPEAQMEVDEAGQTMNLPATICIHCKRAGRQTFDHPSNWTRCPERRLRIGNNRSEKPEHTRTTPNQNSQPKKTPSHKKPKPQAHTNPLSNLTPLPHLLPTPQIQRVSELAAELNLDINRFGEEAIRNAFADICNKYGSQP